MKGDSKKSEFTLREASEHDIPLLSVHHRKMFEEIWEKKGQPIHCSAGDEMEQAYSRKLSTELEAGSCKSWLIEKETTSSQAERSRSSALSPRQTIYLRKRPICIPSTRNRDHVARTLPAGLF